ncbi:MAG TPA: CPBP family intramembrane glutamic endopeptidase [Bacteroidia bacterium]|nr:CPBP family intramembrane glutamic endopeptidase [Bacteroidia bacterium]
MNTTIFKDRLGLITILAYFALCFALMLVENTGASQLPDNAKDINVLKVMQVVLTTVLFILPATIFCRYMRDERSAFLNMNMAPHFYYALTAAACILFALPAVSGLESWNQLIHLPESFGSLESWMRTKETEAEKITLMFFQDKSIGGLIINLLVMAFMAALSEEIFFRGLIQQMLIKNKINVHVAIVITAILFSAFHLQFFGFIPRMFLGIVLGYLYYITQNLWVSIIAHFCNNAFAVVAMHFYNQDVTAEGSANASQPIGVAFVLLSIAMVIGQLVMLKRFANKINTIQ